VVDSPSTDQEVKPMMQDGYLELDCRHTVVLSRRHAEQADHMPRVSIHELSDNPRDMVARLGQGEQVELTWHGEVFAILIPPPRARSRYDELVARGTIQPATGNLTAGDWRQFTHFDVPDDVDPLAVLFKMREDER
jgi:antitoxin (DNA-binding transcriptional repressor) of toxin-antitoxin stability system